MKRLLVLDFDGTMTDAEVEGQPFRAGYLADLAILTGLPLAEVEALAARFEAEIAAAPQDFGWVFNGRIVAPATVDPYLRIMPVARRIFDETGAFPREADRTRLLDGILYKYNYGKTRVAFRPGARDLLLALREVPGLFPAIVTNSHTEAVAHKLSVLGEPDGALDWLRERVYGRAAKYVLDESWEAVPAELRVPGLHRPILLRRRAYHDVLRALLDAQGLDWAELTVVGDIFELDLSLPQAMGARVGLLANAHTPAYERRWLEAHPRGAVLETLDQVLAFAAE